MLLRKSLALFAVGILVFIFFGGNDGPELPEGIVHGNGRIEAAEVDVATKIAGRLETISVREGDLIRPGQVIANLTHSFAVPEIPGGRSDRPLDLGELKLGIIHR